MRETTTKKDTQTDQSDAHHIFCRLYKQHQQQQQLLLNHNKHGIIDPKLKKGNKYLQDSFEMDHDFRHFVQIVIFISFNFKFVLFFISFYNQSFSFIKKKILYFAFF